MTFVRAVSLADFHTQRGIHVFKEGKRQILIRSLGDAIFALDNRCPHEGFPLSKGTTDEASCTLTCNWHNWKFHLEDGRCVVGDDNVRTYPTKVEDDAIWIDLAPPSREAARASILEGLEKGFRRRTYGQIARELARLHFAGFDPLVGVRAAIRWSHDRFEYGMTHAYGALADWLTLYDRFAGDPNRALVPLAETIDHMAFDALRHPRYPYPAEAAPFSASAYLAAVEAEDDAAACAAVLGAVAAGQSMADLEPVLAQAALLHYADFGHCLIYVAKCRQASERLRDPDVDRALLLNLTRQMCYATREDLIPEFDHYAIALRRVDTDEHGSPPETLAGASVRQALDWTVHALATRAPLSVYDDLLGACADLLLHYDISFDQHVDRPVSQNVTWLFYTHALTFSNAVRVICERHPALWPQGLLQIACFVGRGKACVDGDQDMSRWTVDDVGAFEAATYDRLLDHGHPLPIYSAHLLKTSLAVFEELPHATAPTQALLLASLNRFLHSPIKAKHARRLVRQGLELVGRDYS